MITFLNMNIFEIMKCRHLFVLGRKFVGSGDHDDVSATQEFNARFCYKYNMIYT